MPSSTKHGTCTRFDLLLPNYFMTLVFQPPTTTPTVTQLHSTVVHRLLHYPHATNARDSTPEPHDKCHSHFGSLQPDLLSTPSANIQRGTPTQIHMKGLYFLVTTLTNKQWTNMASANKTLHRYTYHHIPITMLSKKNCLSNGLTLSSNLSTGGMKFTTVNGRLILQHMEPSSPGARIHRWRSRLCGAWLIKIGNTEVHTVTDVIQALRRLTDSKATRCILLFSHPEIQHGLTNDGIQQINIDQLNPRLLLQNFPIDGFLLSDIPHSTDSRISKIADGDVFNYTTIAMRLTRGKLLKDPT